MKQYYIIKLYDEYFYAGYAFIKDGDVVNAVTTKDEAAIYNNIREARQAADRCALRADCADYFCVPEVVICEGANKYEHN